MEETNDSNPKISQKEKEEVDSKNNIQNDDNKDKDTDAGEKENKPNFYYLEPKEREEPSVFEYQSKIDRSEAENIFKPHALICKYAICILLKEDGKEDSKLLKMTLDGIISNLGDLGELGIKCENILIYIFVNKIKQNELVTQESIINNLKQENRNNYLLSHLKLKNDERDIKIEVVTKRNYMSDIESLKIFYCQIVNNIKNDKSILITSILTAGVTPTNSALYDLIQACILNDKNDNIRKSHDCICIPALEIDEQMEIKSENFFTKILKYEQTHFNIYDMSFYKSTGTVPILSLFNTMTIDRKLMENLYEFYGNIEILEDNQLPKIDYHDYSLGLYLYQRHFDIKYVNKQIFGTIYYKDFDYKYLWVSKYSGYYSNFFGILNSLKNFDLPILDKIFTLFQIIGLLIEFIYPGLSILVIYSIFIEAFDVYDRYPAWFMTMLYIIMYLASGTSSLIGEKTKEIRITNFICYYFMEIYYLFILACSVPAMDNIKKKKLFGEKHKYDNDLYKFNNAAAGCLITFTVVLAFVPMILRLDQITKNIVPMFLYLVLGAPMSTSYLLIAKIWNAPGASGGKNIEDRKGLTVLFYCLFNLFFGFLSVYIYDRKLRVRCVMGLSIMYLIYLFFKVFGILLSLLGSPDLTKKNSAKTKVILEGENIYQSKNSAEHLNEEKLDKESDKDKENNNDENEEENNKNKEDDNNNNDNNEEEKNDDD